MLNKIWIINQYAAPPEYEVRVRNNMMAHYLIEKGYDVKIISASYIHNTEINLINSKDKFKKANYNDLNFIHIKTASYKGNGISRIKTMIEFPLKLCIFYKQFGDMPDLIICDLDAIFYPFIRYLSKKIKCKVYLEVRDLWPASIGVYKNLPDKSIIMKLLYQMEKKAYISCDKLIFSMEGGMNYIRDKGWDNTISNRKVYYINNGIDLETYEFNKQNYIWKDEQLINDKNFKVFYVGSIRKANGVGNIIEVAKLIKQKKENISFYVFGEGDERELLIDKCKEEKINNVYFKGAINKKFVPSVLQYSNLNYIHFKDSYLKKYGASLNKLFEYLASGKPIICDCVFYKDIINENSCGISMDNPTINEVVDEIIRLKNMSQDEYNEICKNCINTSKQYDYKKLTNKLINIIEKE